MLTTPNIIHVIKGIPNPSTMNGVNKVVHHLATAQCEAGCNVQVWAITEPELKVTHEHIYPLETFTTPSGRFRSSPAMITRLSSVDPMTVFHFHSVFLPEFYVFSRHLRARGFRWVISPHGGYAPESRKKNSVAKQLYMTLFENKLINQASALHAIGTFGEADQFDKWDLQQRVGLVHNGQALFTVHKETYPTSGPLVISFCGRLALRHKGLDLLLSGAAIARKRGVDVRIEIVGEGPDREELFKLASELGISDHVRFHGQMHGDHKLSILMSSDIFAHTSRWEGIPTAALEAASLGLPLLITLPTNLGDFVGKNDAGYVACDLDVATIAASIASAAQDKPNSELKRKGQAARKMIAGEFDWAYIGKLMQSQVYAKVSGETAISLLPESKL